MIRQLGQEGVEIKQMKEMLFALGYPIQSVDSFFDENTRNVVMAFQNDALLRVTGILDENTYITLLSTVKHKGKDVHGNMHSVYDSKNGDAHEDIHIIKEQGVEETTRTDAHKEIYIMKEQGVEKTTRADAHEDIYTMKEQGTVEITTKDAQLPYYESVRNDEVQESAILRDMFAFLKKMED